MAAKPREKFDAAVRVIQSLPKNGSFQPSNDLMLMFYAYFKQATIGPCTTPRPSFWDVVGKAKWEAWNKLGNMTAEQAMLNYVEELKKTMEVQFGQRVDEPQIIEAMPHTNMVAEFVEKLGSFYELVDDRIVVNGAALKKESGITVNGSGDHLTQKSTTEDDPKSDLGSDHDVSVSCSSPQQSSSVTAVSSNDVVVMTTKPVKPILGNASDDEPEPVSQPPELNGRSVENGQLSDDDLELESDSDGEEFCDTSDLPEQPKVSESRASSHNMEDHITETSESESSVRDEEVASQVMQNDPVVMAAVTSRGGGELGAEGQPTRPAGQDLPMNPTIPSMPDGTTEDQSPSRRTHFLAAGGAGGGGHYEGSIDQSSEVTEQIAVALVRLQQDMNSILARLNTLEALSLAQHQIERSRHASESERVARRQPWWWPFPQLEGRTVFFIMVWPLLIHWVLSMLARRRHRRR